VDENNQYLVENYSFTYLTSGRDLLRLQNQSPSQQQPVIMGDPNFKKPGEAIALETNTRTFNLSNQVTTRLKGTKDEVEAIAQKLGVTALTDTQATEQRVKQINSPSILHIATHGFFANSERSPENQTTIQDNPLLLSGLVLAGFKVSDSGTQEDGILTAQETTLLDLVGTKLVVLSACDTGTGSVSAGEGIYGLRRALVIAGAESQVISLWKVADDATKDLMIAYYDKLLANEGRSEALRQTQLEMLKHEKYNHPYYWAAFIPSGDWRPLDR
ncbi:MAG: CHAT domain-containing protein, partial [Spirulinaceae cyanobacterium]